MLNKDLKLNENLFNEDVEKAATRDGYGKGLVALGDEDPNIVALCADLTESTRTDEFAKKYPERFFEMGVAEQNMAAIAAGLAVSGKTPFIASYATFSPGKNWETIRTTIVYNEANVKIAGHHAGLMTGPDGATHQATEDISSTRAWPIIKILVPADSIEARKATIAAGKTEGPFYLRYTRDKSPVITTDETPFEIGKSYVYWVGENPQVTIIAMGFLLYNSLVAAKILEEDGINTEVINASSIKPMDEETILSSVKKTNAVVTVEDHQVAGGLGGAVAELLAKHRPTPQEFIGLQNTFGESGTPAELVKKFGMDHDSIVKAVKKVIERK